MNALQYQIINNIHNLAYQNMNNGWNTMQNGSNLMARGQRRMDCGQWGMNRGAQRTQFAPLDGACNASRTSTGHISRARAQLVTNEYSVDSRLSERLQSVCDHLVNDVSGS